MAETKVQIFYDGNGAAQTVQMPIGDYEKIIKSAKSTMESREIIHKVTNILKASI